MIVQTAGEAMGLVHEGRGRHPLVLLQPHGFDGEWSTSAEVSARLRHEADAAPIGFTLGAAMKLAGTPLDAALSRADERLYEERARRKP